jgi:pyrroloquinoline quinone biosynthesis protein D
MLAVDRAAVPSYARGVRLRHDPARGTWIILGPERMFMPNPHALEVLHLIDGVRSVGAMIDGLAARFTGSREMIAGDVAALLEELIAKGVLVS